MFNQFSQAITKKLENIAKKNKLSESELKSELKEIRLILLEADVNFKVAKEFINKIELEANNSEILNGLNPGEQVVKLVKDEMLKLFGDEKQKLNIEPNQISIILMAGLQGSGKTTTTGKLANFLRKKKYAKKPLLIAADIYRPAAITQLKTIGRELGVEVYSEEIKDVLKIVQSGIQYAKENNHDLVIIDTAGRLHIDDEMLLEIQRVAKNVNPDETFLVIDATIGQDSVNVAKTFNETIPLTGIIITKLDGDARGGAAMSVRSVTGVAIKFIGVSEKMDGLEYFDPNRMVSRILGMGDMIGLIEEVEDNISEQEAKEMEEKFRKNQFTLTDFLKQMKMMKKMGGFSKIMGMIPGMNKMQLPEIPEGEMNKMQAIIESMTINEREKPNILNASRRKRIALGSGTQVQDVNKLIKGYENAKVMMGKMKNMDMNDPNLINKLMNNKKF